MNGIGGVLAAVLPSIGVGLLFWFAIRALMNADRNERRALARMDAAEREQNLSQNSHPAPDSPPSN